MSQEPEQRIGLRSWPPSPLFLAVQKRARHQSETNAEVKEQTEERMPEIESAAEPERPDIVWKMQELSPEIGCKKQEPKTRIEREAGEERLLARSNTNFQSRNPRPARWHTFFLFLLREKEKNMLKPSYSRVIFGQLKNEKRHRMSRLFLSSPRVNQA